MVSWIQPETDWSTTERPIPRDLNRIEGNEQYLKDALEDEVSDRELAVSTEAASRATADSTITAALAAEVAARAAADRKPYNGVVYRFGSDLTFGELRDLLSPYMPNSGDNMCLNGSIHFLFGGYGVLFVASMAHRHSDGDIEIEGLMLKLSSLEVSASPMHLASGDATTIINCALSW